MSLALAVLPILLTILCGYLLAATRALPAERWDAINVLNFKLLIPATLIHAIAVSDLSSIASGPWMIALLLTLAGAGTAAMLVRALVPRSRLPDPAFTTLFQTTTRWNAFMALAAAEQFAGPAGLGFLALGIALMVPTINIANIVVLVVYGTAQTSLRAIVTSLVRNPLIQGCAIGLVISLGHVPVPAPVLDSVELIGRAALGVGLLSVGAGILPRRLIARSGRMWLGVVLRLGLCPLLFLGIGAALGLGREELLAGSLIFTVPAAVNGYVIARQMGGDADLYADILTWQTVLSIPLLPLVAWAAVALG